LIDYRLRVHGIPLLWRTCITLWQPPHRFIDEQLRGPCRQWTHEHRFEQRNGGTLMRDSIRYRVPFDFLRWFVRPDIENIFEFRSTALRQRFSDAVL